MSTKMALLLTLIFIAISGCPYAVVDSSNSEDTTATFSIVAYDVETKEWGVAVASKVLAVGYIVPWARAGVGAVATQALADVSYGPDGLALLEEGMPPADALDVLLLADEDREQRQVGMVDGESPAQATIMAMNDHRRTGEERPNHIPTLLTMYVGLIPGDCPLPGLMRINR